MCQIYGFVDMVKSWLIITYAAHQQEKRKRAVQWGGTVSQRIHIKQTRELPESADSAQVFCYGEKQQVTHLDNVSDTISKETINCEREHMQFLIRCQ